MKTIVYIALLSGYTATNLALTLNVTNKSSNIVIERIEAYPTNANNCRPVTNQAGSNLDGQGPIASGKFFTHSPMCAPDFQPKILIKTLNQEPVIYALHAPSAGTLISVDIVDGPHAPEVVITYNTTKERFSLDGTLLLSIKN
jgi:hypothetical protein